MTATGGGVWSEAIHKAAKRDHESQNPGSERSAFHSHSFLDSY